MARTDQTYSHEIGPRRTRRGPIPHLFLALVSDRPALGSSRFSLEGIDEVAIGRADETQARVEGRRLSLSIADRWMSGGHAKVRKVYNSWVLEDSRSKNGSLVNGRRVTLQPLADGDVIELGHTFLLFRESAGAAAGGAAIVDGSDLRPAAAGLATLVPSLAEQFGRVQAIAASRIPVVIEGETGTGKELVASAIHAISGRRGPFVPVNCGALAPALMQSELFGYAKDAFPGAGEGKAGIIQAAEGGTLFLDEIADLPPASQPLLLRMLQEGEILPVGATRPVKVDVRVVAATQRDLRALAAENKFRTDLLARLSGLDLVLPPLRDRREDLGLLIRDVLQGLRGEASANVSFTPEAARALLLYRWPLNVRELEKALQAALVLASDGPVALEHLPAAISRSSQPATASVTDAAPAAPQVSAAQHFIDELWRRHVVRVLVAYAVAAFGALQGLDIIVTRLALPPRLMTWVVLLTLLGMPVAGVLAWIFDWTHKGIVRTPDVAPHEIAPAPVRRSRRRLVLAAAGVLVLVVAGGALWWRHRAPAIPALGRTR